MQSFVHSVSGTFTNENVTGIHFYDELKVRVIEVLETNENGVWKAKIEAFDYRTKKWKEKIKAISRDKLIIINVSKAEYHYKKATPINILEPGVL